MTKRPTKRFIVLLPFDLDGFPRFFDDPDSVDCSAGGCGTAPIVDMGAYEFRTDCNVNGLPDECDLDCAALGGACDQATCGQSADCNSNDIPDACDITDCTPASLDYPGCDDCNLNGVPDACDIAGPTSDDVNLDEVPDECISPDTSGVNWNDPIWTAGDEYPDNDPDNPDGIPDQHVVLKDVDLLLNVSVEIDTLTIQSGASR